MREPPTTSMLETVIAKEMPMVNQFVHRLHSELFLLDYDESVSFLFLFCFYVCQSNYWFMLMSYHVWLRVDNGVKECVHSCVCVYIICLQPTQCYMHTCIIFICVGVSECVYVTACMWLQVRERERERERSHWYCAVTLLHYHDYVFTLLCIECFIYDSWYWWWDNFPSFFPPFRGCCMHTKGHWNLHRYGKEKHIISITDSNPGFLAFFF